MHERTYPLQEATWPSEATPVVSEAALIAGIRRGAPEDFRVLVERYQHQVFALLTRMGFDRDTTEDLAQESFVRAWKALGSFRGDSQFSTWLYRIVYHQALQLVRQRERQTRLVQAAQRIRDCSPAPLEGHRQWELRSTLDACLAQLPASQRMALALYYFHEQSYEEVATTMDIPLNTVKTHIRRGKQRLRELLS